MRRFMQTCEIVVYLKYAPEMFHSIFRDVFKQFVWTHQYPNLPIQRCVCVRSYSYQT